MKRISAFACLFAASLCAPAGLFSQFYSQESLLLRTVRTKSGIVYSLAFSTDGKNIVSGGVDTSLRLWNTADGSEALALRGHTNFINAVAYSPDGRLIASASEDAVIKVWDAETGECVKTFKGHSDSISSLAFFPDGERLATGSNDGTIRLWSLDKKAPYRTIRARSGYVYSLAVSSDGTRIASGGNDATVKLWDAGTGARLLTFEGHGGAVNAVAFSPAANYLVSAAEDGFAKIWRLEDGMCVKTFSQKRQPLYAVAYSPDGNNVFAGGSDNQVTVWRVTDSMLLREYTGHTRQIKTLAVSADGKFVASGSYDKSVKLWVTPWESDRRDKEARDKEAKEVERNRNYDQHYSAGVQALGVNSKSSLEKAVTELTQARTFKDTEACQAKLKEAQAALDRKLAEVRRNTEIAVKGGSGLAALIIALAIFMRGRKKAKLRETLPEEIKSETLAGSYERALGLYSQFKSIGGDPARLPRLEMLELYRGLKALSDLARENLPYGYLLSYAQISAQEGNYKLALTMLRSGRLLDQFRNPQEFDAFVDIFTRAGRPDSLLLLKLNPGPYTSLAEALFKAGDLEYCEKMLGLKKQFYADKFTPKDAELQAACRKKIEELAAQKKNVVLKWRCINCGHVAAGQLAPDSCPGCMHPRDHFQLLKE